MKKVYLALVGIVFLTVQASEADYKNLAQNDSYLVAAAKKRRSTTKARASTSSRELALALAKARAGDYPEAASRLFQLSQSSKYRSKRTQIKYILGLMLYQMKLNQVAAFQFISVLRDKNSKYVRQALEKLSLAANTLGDDTLLNYAISRVNVNQFPRVHRDMLYYRIGEYQMRNKQFGEAADSFRRVKDSSALYGQAKYLEATSYAEAKNPKKAVQAFDELVESRRGHPVTDSARVAGLMGRARSLYQAQEWDQAIEAYRQVPRDTLSWHDTMFESSWAMLRSGRFRSSLSNFQSLHSDYYENFYLPESLLLRSIVYLYICKYEEMEKVLNLYNKIYKPVYKKLQSYLNTKHRPESVYAEFRKFMEDYQELGDEINKNAYALPPLLMRKIIKEGDFKRTNNYIARLNDEEAQIKNMSGSWQNSGIGRYSVKVLKTRIAKAKQKAGRIILAHLNTTRVELLDLFEQEGFIRYEMINGRKETIKKKVAGKDLAEAQVDDQAERDYYVQNGYEYWPFSGEYWLDELGNYHYVGTQSCR